MSQGTSTGMTDVLRSLEHHVSDLTTSPDSSSWWHVFSPHTCHSCGHVCLGCFFFKHTLHTCTHARSHWHAHVHTRTRIHRCTSTLSAHPPLSLYVHSGKDGLANGKIAINALKNVFYHRHSHCQNTVVSE